MIAEITADLLIQDLGWTLVHSIWQFALLAGVLWIALKVIPRDKEHFRYIASVCTLVLAFLLPAGTFWQVSLHTDETFRFAGMAYLDEAYLSSEQKGLAATNASEKPFSTATNTLTNGSGLETAAALKGLIIGQLPTFFPFAIAIWLLGVAFFSIRLGGGLWQIRSVRTKFVEPVETEWADRFAKICSKLRVARPITLVRSTVLSTPIAVGVFKPMILVPAGLFLQIDPRQLESIIAHELIHIRRFDALVSIVQGLAETLFFFHPCIWWISRRIAQEREFAADAAVVEAFADDHLTYATALANLEEIRLRANVNTPSLAAAANGGNLMQRIERILKNKTEIRSTGSAWTAGLALVFISAVLLTVFSFTPRSSVNAQQRARGDRKIAIGFVAIPPVDRSVDPPKDSDATARLIIAKLQQYKIPATGFVNGASISDGEKLFPVRANILRMWRDAGLDVGIGTYRHISFYNTPYEDYIASVGKNEAIVNKILAEKNLKLRYFSYPYLNTGKSVDDRDRFEQWLRDRGLTSVKYTVDNQEWMYSYAYDMARNDNDVNTMNEIHVAFIKYMDKMMDHYEAYSQEMFGRDIAQTMVLTPSRLVADAADDLFGLLQKRGYKFVPIDEAQADEAYKTPENMVGNFGNSWFERWTHTQGRKLRDEPTVAAVVSDIWQKRKPEK